MGLHSAGEVLYLGLPCVPCESGWSDQYAVCVEDLGGPKERFITYSRLLRGEYCIVFMQHNAAI